VKKIRYNTCQNYSDIGYDKSRNSQSRRKSDFREPHINICIKERIIENTFIFVYLKNVNVQIKKIFLLIILFLFLNYTIINTMMY